MIRVTDVRYVRDYMVWLRFNDCIEGELDLRRELHGEVFEPLRDKELFGSVKLHSDWHTIVWPNGADFAPEFLHAAIKARITSRSSRPRPRGGPRRIVKARAGRRG